MPRKPLDAEAGQESSRKPGVQRIPRLPSGERPCRRLMHCFSEGEQRYPSLLWFIARLSKYSNAHLLKYTSTA